MNGKILSSVLAAAGGAALGVLYAPDKGTETRRKISSKKDEFSDKIDTEYCKFKDNVQQKFEHVKSDLSNMLSKKGENKMEAVNNDVQRADNDLASMDDRFTSYKQDDPYSPATGI
jgi:gas vesicle protein